MPAILYPNIADAHGNRLSIGDSVEHINQPGLVRTIAEFYDKPREPGAKYSGPLMALRYEHGVTHDYKPSMWRKVTPVIGPNGSERAPNGELWAPIGKTKGTVENYREETWICGCWRRTLEDGTVQTFGCRTVGCCGLAQGKPADKVAQSDIVDQIVERVRESLAKHMASNIGAPVIPPGFTVKLGFTLDEPKAMGVPHCKRCGQPVPADGYCRACGGTYALALRFERDFRLWCFAVEHPFASFGDLLAMEERNR